MIDTHSHLYTEDFADDIDDVMARAREAGVEKVFLPNINAATVEPMIALVNRYSGFCYPMIGLHPEDLDDDWRDVLTEMEPHLSRPNNPFIGVGEVGLDYYWDRSRYEEQQEAFAIQVGWALRYGLPLMVHTRSAHREMVDVLKSAIAHHRASNPSFSSGELTGVFHCFGGTAAEARELLEFEGFMLGIGGLLTFKKSQLPDVLRQTVPLSRIVVETDSPYLAPVPHRGKRNESAFVREVILKLADIYEVDALEVENVTTQNALHTFPKSQ